MKRTIALLAVGILASAPALAGEVFGKIVEGNASVGGAATVEAKCGSKVYPPVKTDKGSYHLVLAESGKCTMTVTFKEKSASLEIASYDDPVQVDLALEIKDGKLTARRK